MIVQFTDILDEWNAQVMHSYPPLPLWWCVEQCSLNVELINTANRILEFQLVSIRLGIITACHAEQVIGLDAIIAKHLSDSPPHRCADPEDALPTILPTHHAFQIIVEHPAALLVIVKEHLPIQITNHFINRYPIHIAATSEYEYAWTNILYVQFTAYIAQHWVARQEVIPFVLLNLAAQRFVLAHRTAHYY